MHITGGINTPGIVLPNINERSDIMDAPTLIVDPRHILITNGRQLHIIHIRGTATGQIQADYKVPAHMVDNITVIRTRNMPSIFIFGRRPNAYEPEFIPNPVYIPGSPEFIPDPEYWNPPMIPNPDFQPHLIPNPNFGDTINPSPYIINPLFDPNIPEFIPDPDYVQDPATVPLVPNPAFGPEYIPNPRFGPIIGSFDMVIWREGVSDTVRIDVNLTPGLPGDLPCCDLYPDCDCIYTIDNAIRFEPPYLLITDDNISNVVQLTGEMYGNISLETTIPERFKEFYEIEWNPLNSSFIVKGLRPSIEISPIQFVGTINVTRGGETRGLPVYFNITTTWVPPEPGAPEQPPIPDYGSNVMIDGIWRHLWGAYVMIDGEWRLVEEINNMIDNNWSGSHNHFLSAENIKYFRMVYEVDKGAEHINQPQLSFNPKIPVDFYVTGEDHAPLNSKDPDLLTKGILYQFHDAKYNLEEGVYKFKGTLYAVLDNGLTIAISRNIIDNVNDIRDTTLAGEFWITTRLDRLLVRIHGYNISQVEGNVSGWNRFFEDEDTWNIKNGWEYGIYYETAPRIISPISSRPDNFEEWASVGIARSVTKPDDNMVNSRGIIDHTIQSIRVNDEPVPFVIEILE